MGPERSFVSFSKVSEKLELHYMFKTEKKGEVFLDFHQTHSSHYLIQSVHIHSALLLLLCPHVHGSPNQKNVSIRIFINVNCC